MPPSPHTPKHKAIALATQLKESGRLSTEDLHGDYPLAALEFAYGLMDSLYPQGGWEFIPHPDRMETVGFGSQPFSLFTVLLTVRIETPASPVIITLGYCIPTSNRNYHHFTIHHYTGWRMLTLPEELCRLDDLGNLTPSADTIKKAAEFIEDATVEVLRGKS